MRFRDGGISGECSRGAVKASGPEPSQRKANMRLHFRMASCRRCISSQLVLDTLAYGVVAVGDCCSAVAQTDHDV